jgi:hypothetical protein
MLLTENETITYVSMCEWCISNTREVTTLLTHPSLCAHNATVAASTSTWNSETKPLDFTKTGRNMHRNSHTHRKHSLFAPVLLRERITQPPRSVTVTGQTKLFHFTPSGDSEAGWRYPESACVGTAQFQTNHDRELSRMLAVQLLTA